MTDKKKQGAVVAVATMLTVTSVLSPVATVYATETDTAIVQHTETEQIKENAPPIELPQELAGFAGQTLQEIALPEGWSWTDENAVISKDKMEYPARITVDDETYDYSNVEGYYANGHYVEHNVVIAVTEQEPVTESIENQPPISTFGSDLDKDVFSSPKAGNVVIDGDTFPDTIFREWVIANVAGADDKVLTSDEISNITDIDISQFADRVNIESLQGIEYFTELLNLNCRGTTAIGIRAKLKSLDVSKNTKLEKLNCSDNANLATLNVKGANALKQLECNGTGITALDVSENKDLDKLFCQKTKIKELDVSNNTALIDLFCDSNDELISLNVSGAVALEHLDCGETGITALDVSENKALKNLNCRRTKIKSLDVSENIALEQLYCIGNLLSWLNIGVKMGHFYDLPTPTIIADVSTDSFNIKDVAKGIDPQKVIITSNGSIDDYGVISNYDRSQPIQYEYDCGTSYGQPIKLTVNIEFAIDINEANFPDPFFRQYVSDNFDTSNPKDGKLTASEINQITSINITNRTDIKNLKGIEYFTALEVLYCHFTRPAGGSGITSLDVSNNKKLETLYCYNNNSLTTLTVSGADALNDLRCSGTGIKALDVSNNKNLTLLDCTNNPLVWLNIGNNTKLANLFKSDSSIAIKITGNTFNIKDMFPTLDLQKVDITSNGSLDKDKGIVTVDNADKPVIYTYDCGTSKKGAETLYVSLDLNIKKKDSSITINKDLNKTYDGKPIENPTVDTTGSTGNVIFTYEVKNSDKWEAYSETPTNAGTYRVTTHLQENGFFNSAEAQKEFTISQATNSWINDLAITGWTFGEQANDPTAKAKFGDIINYFYSDSEKGTYTDKVPTTAGTWYVKAVVPETDNYTGMESIKEFKIEKAKDTWVEEPAILDWVFGEAANKPTANAKSGGKVSFTYSSSEKGTYTDKVPMTAGTWYMKATVADSNNYTGIESIKKFEITKAKDTWVEKPAILDWVFGEAANTPTAKAKSGEKVIFTYSSSEKGTYTKDVPTTVGTWYMKATVADSNNYTGMESIKEFKITKAKDTWLEEPAILDWVFGEAANTPTAKAKSGEKVIFTYSSSEKGTYTKDVPTTVGTWYMKATVADSNNYTGMESIKEFKITKAKDTWLEEPAILDWVFGEAASTPTAKAKSSGKVIFTYSSSESGTYTKDVPTTAGTWYMKATVADSDNYKGLESIISFTITPKSAENNSQIVIPDINSDKDVENLVIKDGDKELIKGTDYDVEKKQDNNKVTVTITFKGNYAGTVIKTYTVEDKKPSDSTKNDKTPAVETGDTATTGIWAMLAALSAGTLALLKGKKHKEETEE